MIKIILLAYLLLINIITYFTYAADKTKARQNKWRIPERTLILLALLGGSPAALLAMKHYHHKTRHLKFKLGIPIILISNNNHIFSLPKYLKYLISQHSRLTGAVRPLYPKHNTKRNYPPRGAAPLYITSLLQILQSTRPPFHNPSNFAPASALAARQADGWSFDNLERLADRNKVHHFP